MPLFHSDFEAGDFREWDVVQNHVYNGPGHSYPGTDYAAQIIDDPLGLNGKVFKCVLHDGDTAAGSNERSEVQGTNYVTGGQEGDERWYEFQVGFDPDFPTDHASTGFALVFQFHDQSGGSPPVGVYVDTSPGNWGLRIQRQSSPGVFIESIVAWEIPMVKGVWHKIKLRIKWSESDSVGFVELWHNDVKQLFTGGPGEDTYRTTIRTLTPGGGGTYVKMGYFRSVDFTATGTDYFTGLTVASSEAELNPTAPGGTVSLPTVSNDQSYVKPVRSGLRVIVQEILSRKFLEWDLPLVNVRYKHQLCGPDVITGELTPELPNLMAIGFDAGAVWLHVERDGQIVSSGILQPQDQMDASLTVEAEGFTGYAHGIPYLDEWTLGSPVGVNIDPLDAVREGWRHIQAFGDSSLGVTIDTTTSPVRIGKPKQEVQFETEQGEQVEFEAGPFGWNWWDSLMIGSEIDKLAVATPFEYREQVAWNPTKSDVTHHLRLGYPRLGRKRDDLVFEEGRNITSLLPFHEDVDYASHIIVVGRGEGRDQIQGQASTRLGRRIRKVKVINEKATADNRAKANALAGDYLGKYTPTIEIKQIEVWAHSEEAPEGSYQCGDDIFVRGEIPYIGRVGLWHRVIGISPDTVKGTVVIELYRTDRFIYGPMGQTGLFAQTPDGTWVDQGSIRDSTFTQQPPILVLQEDGTLVPPGSYT